jgi:glycosyltransferase involved in cell wall biosynthesis
LGFIKFFNPNLYYDFDDAMYAAPDGKKFPATVKAAPHVVAGTAVLAARARALNPSVAIIPTAIFIPDPDPGPRPASTGFTVSWVGTAANLPYLQPVLEALENLNRDGSPVQLRILTEKPDQAPQRPWIRALTWSRAEEEKEFRRCDVGLMPLPDTEWCAGKCACKALQYLSYGKPIIASPVGVNSELFAHRPFAKLARNREEWENALNAYRENPDSRVEAGQAGMSFVRERFDVHLWAAELAAHVLKN